MLFPNNNWRSPSKVTTLQHVISVTSLLVISSYLLVIQIGTVTMIEAQIPVTSISSGNATVVIVLMMMSITVVLEVEEQEQFGVITINHFEKC